VTVYVIDPSKPLPPTTGDYEHALQIVDGDTVLLAQGADIRASGYMADGINASGRVNLFITVEFTALSPTGSRCAARSRSDSLGAWSE
jgi:hypothetical protein